MNVAIVGNQNSGKTTLFNMLTGSNQRVGNWPGVTIDKKEGKIKGEEIDIIDLPGIYSLMPYTEEENITRDYLLHHTVDMVINLIDVNALERSLYLTTQLMDLEIPFVIALNMCEIFEKKGMQINEQILAKNSGVDVVRISAKTGKGFDELIDIIKKEKTQKYRNNIKKFPKIIENSIENVKRDANIDNNFLAIERLITDNRYRDSDLIKKLYGENIEHTIAQKRYEFIADVKKRCVSGSEKAKTISDKIDNVILNKWIALPIFIFTMIIMYSLSVGVVGKLTGEKLLNLFGDVKIWLANGLVKLGASNWVVSLICDGIVSGVGAVLTFLPQLIIIFLFINFLESSGYMSRVSFIFDKIFYKFGLSGKALIPFIIGTGCSVPAISATRTIEQSGEKEKTIMLVPFVPCSAKLPIISLFVSYFFEAYSGLVTASIYFVAVIMIVSSAVMLDRIFYRNKNTSFVFELPEYKLPRLGLAIKDVWFKTKEFVVRAGTIIVVCSIAIWFLSSFNLSFRYCENIQISILAKLGSLLSWFFYPIIGELNWAVGVSALQGLIAKEQVVSSMSIISELSGGQLASGIFSSDIFSCFNNASAYAFVLFNLFSAPCLASIGTMKNELKSTRKTMFAVFFQIIGAWIFSALVFQMWRLFL